MDFAAALDVTVGEIERPPLPPAGYYRWKITKPASMSTNKDDTWEIVEFPCQAQEALDGVDPQELQDFGGLKSVRLSHKFLFDKQEGGEHETAFKRTLFGMRQFLIEHLGLSAEMSLKEAVGAAQGMEFIAPVEYRKGKDRQTGQETDEEFAQMGRTAPVA